LESKDLYDVYYFENARELDKYTKKSFIKAREEALKENKTMVVMVDEVHQNPTACVWTYLLKKAADIILIGVGIPKVYLSSPHFRKKYPPSVIYFDCKSVDMKELIDLFAKQTMGRDDISRDDIAAICHYICEYTSGHMFPMLKFCEHIFDPAQTDYVHEYGKYFTSKAFFDHIDYVEVRDRCFSDLPYNPIYKILHGGTKSADNVATLDKLGLWNEDENWFISKCLIDVIYNTLPKGDNELFSDVSFHDLSVEKKRLR
jgi:hypothetical protein